MSVIFLIIILAIIILAHEFGHFIVAKKSGMRVDEFGFGFPPKLFGFKMGETLYTLNAIPFGGFVKIPGEDGGEQVARESQGRTFAEKSMRKRMAVIAAGVIFNIILAWFLISFGLMIGSPMSKSAASDAAAVKNAKVTIIGVAKDSPAEEAGLKVGDKLIAFSSVEELQNFVAVSAGKEVEIGYERGKEMGALTLIPRVNPPEGEGAIGIAMDEIGTLRLAPHKAVIEGAKTVYNLTIAIIGGLYYFILDVTKGTAGLDSVAGPVGIVSLTGSAASLGFAYLINFAAFLSINIAILNILPFPALDGGRLLFLIIEKIKGSPLNPKFSHAANTVGMIMLLVFMAVVTYSDIAKLFS
ncbi:MAG: RIP metalloprotease RseP [Candidatus Terrybacteria bacterium CG10_big_fil_rev_8_21_14_0_10_41_10]|uniref:Zinc metalloprotease n=1 Tax=Candidatus Terrybacteria bacterium CG10_big_fil_rev_8_21_14_0_10_41_10 TaxID=1975026 RepID=A0A2M8LAR1_9BACT|nr:MAG: RIP metalloprotease RseP [Candidatus Terrybacteria bacterium CG10_big_fil_rev_8_21_14_0_10_41_10]